jgi:hypothetical protein
VVATQDLAEFAYNGDCSRMKGDVENLRRRGLVKETTLADTVHESTRVIALTKEGHKLLARGNVVASDQAIYHGLKKPKEAFHDADLYRLYHKASDEIEGRGGRVDRVLLDYEMKAELYAKLAEALEGETREGERETIRRKSRKATTSLSFAGRFPSPICGSSIRTRR